MKPTVVSVLLLMILVFSCSDKQIVTQSTVQQVFESILQEADSYYDRELWEKAKEKYGNALDIQPHSTYAKNKYEECIQLMKTGNRYTPELICVEIVAQADALFENGSYSRAHTLYLRAKTLDCSDSLRINTQITSAKQIIDAQ